MIKKPISTSLLIALYLIGVCLVCFPIIKPYKPSATPAHKTPSVSNLTDSSVDKALAHFDSSANKLYRNIDLLKRNRDCYDTALEAKAEYYRTGNDKFRRKYIKYADSTNYWGRQIH